MKTMLHFRILLAALFLVFAHGAGAVAGFEGTKTLNKSVKVPADVTLQMSNYSGDIKIFTSADNSVSIKTMVEITGNSKEDVDKVIAAIDKFKFSLTGNTLEIDTKFYKSMNTINNKSTMTLLNDDKIKIQDFKISHELYIPKSANLSLNNKYSDIETESFNGNVDLVLYNSKLMANNFAGRLKIEAKYSNLKMGNAEKDVDFDIYDTDVEIESCGNMNIKSKYSKLEIKKAAGMKIDSYDDKFTVETMSSLNFTSKYSDFVSSSDVTEVRLEIYDCNVTVNSVERAFFNGKYSDVRLGNVGALKIDDSYDNNLYLGNTAKIEVTKSKYCLFEIKSLSNLLMTDVYDDVIKIEKLNSNFAGLSVNGKYGKLEIYAGTVPFRVDFNMKYPKVDIPENLKVSKQIKDDSNLELVAGDTGGIIKVRGYDMKVVIE